MNSAPIVGEGQTSSSGTPTAAGSHHKVAVAAVVVVVASVVLLPVHDQMRFALYPQDEGILLVYPSLLFKGVIPNRGFESVYGSVNYLVLGAAFKVLGTSVVVERVVGLVYRLVVVGSLVTLAYRRRGPGAALCAGVSSGVILAGTIGLAAFSWLAGLAFVGLGFVLVDMGLSTVNRRWATVLAGVCFGLALGCRIDMAAGVGLGIVAVLVLRPAARVPLTSGVLVGLAPLVMNVVQAGPAAVLRQQVLTPIFVTGPSRRLPLSSLGWQGIGVLLLCGVIGGGLVTFGVREAKRDRTQWIGVLMLALGIVDLGLLPEVLQRSDTAHLALTACWVVPSAVLLPPYLLPNGARRQRTARSTNLVPPVVSLVALLLVGASAGRVYWSALPVVGTPAPVLAVVRGDRSVPVPSAEVQQQLDALIAEVDARTHPGQRLFVGPQDLSTAGYSDTYLYYLFPELSPATKYLEMDPGVSNGVGSTLAQELRTADVLILNSAYDNFADADLATRHGSESPNQIVASDFEPVTTSGTWTLYIRR